ncbi:MAG: homocysteine S-methyltransferase family protein, partial [Anaerolineaceae bacterium]|nr:homocysteine S-methyltransferase family protein [Anaerolineaceae bacterium]
MNLDSEAFGGEQYSGCNDYLVISQPSAVEAVHRSFLEVGVDVIETCTFRSNRLTLAEYGLQDQVYTINRAAAELARRLADTYASVRKPRFVAGSMGPSGKLPSMNDPELSNITFDQLALIFKEQALGLIAGGVDVLLLETAQDILEVKAAIEGIQQAFAESNTSLPVQCQVTLDTTGRMLLGTDIHAVLAILEDLPIDVIGLNCSTGPEHMREPIRILGETSTLPVSCIPNAGLPINVDGVAVYPLQPEAFASDMLEFVDRYKVNIIGGCCGTTPEHIRLLVEKLDGRCQSFRSVTQVPRLASAIQVMPMHQQPRPFLIGERLNTQGSQKFKKLILTEDYDGILSIARKQVEQGAHALDICVALTERADETEVIQRVIRTLTPVTTIPLVIDTTEPAVLEAALKTSPGRCLVNSTHLEGGKDKMDVVLSLAKRYNAAVIALTIDQTGMAKTADRKLDIARQIYEIAVGEHGFKPHDLVFDALTFTLATGDPEYANSAIDTLEGIRLIKSEFPGVLTSLGVSNVSFGFTPPARAVLNSIMLYHAVQAGLDMAIVNPAHITPYPDIPSDARKLAEDLLYNRHPDAFQLFIEYFENAGKSLTPDRDDPEKALMQMPAEERLHWRILHRQREGVEKDIEEIIQRPDTPDKQATAIRILNSVLLPAMKDVGDRFGTGELILPFVLQSAEVMKKSVSYVEQYLEKSQGVSKGTLVLATVYGDVHDIGKNLVKTILINNGFQVIDLGKQVPAETIISKAIEVKADAIGLSALLVSTSKQMPLIV